MHGMLSARWMSATFRPCMLHEASTVTEFAIVPLGIVPPITTARHRGAPAKIGDEHAPQEKAPEIG